MIKPFNACLSSRLDTCRVESVGGCKLDLRLGMRNDGVRLVQPGRFDCVLTREVWRNVEGLLEPFSESEALGSNG